MVKRWDYIIVDLVSGQPVTVELGKAWLDQTRPVLQQMGDQGWELVQILGACAYFKRELVHSS